MREMTPDLKPPRRLIDAFKDAFKTRPDFLVRVPGRVNLVGAHVDYNDGWVLPAAISRYVWAAAKALPTRCMSIRAVDLNEDTAFRLTELDTRRSLLGRPLPRWAEYAAGVAWSLQEAGLATPGVQLAISGDVPVGAGMSSSAAVEAAYALALKHITGWEIDRLGLARLCQRAENEYVGVECGIMDQFSVLFGQEDHALLLDCRTLEWEAVPLPDHVSLVVADTGTRRELTDGSLNARRAECREAVQILQEQLPGITALRDVTIDRLFAHDYLLPEKLRMRAEHVITEINRVLAAAEHLRKREVNALGVIMDESYVSSRDLYESSSPELDAMWEAASNHPDRLGGRFLGAGGGGCLIFLVQSKGVESFITHTARRYMEQTGRRSTFYTLQAVDGAQVLPFRE